jgi:hypothetical protein
MCFCALHDGDTLWPARYAYAELIAGVGTVHTVQHMLPLVSLKCGVVCLGKVAGESYLASVWVCVGAE